MILCTSTLTPPTETTAPGYGAGTGFILPTPQIRPTATCRMNTSPTDAMKPLSRLPRKGLKTSLSQTTPKSPTATIPTTTVAKYGQPLTAKSTHTV